MFGDSAADALLALLERAEAAEWEAAEALALADARCQEKAFVEDALRAVERDEARELQAIAHKHEAAMETQRDTTLAALRTAAGALKPFAKAADDFGDHWLNCEDQWNEGGHGLDVGTLRLARAALAEIRKALEASHE